MKNRIVNAVSSARYIDLTSFKVNKTCLANQCANFMETLTWRLQQAPLSVVLEFSVFCLLEHSDKPEKFKNQEKKFLSFVFAVHEALVLCGILAFLAFHVIIDIFEEFLETQLQQICSNI